MNKIHDDLASAGYYYLTGDISMESVKPAIEWILEKNLGTTNRALTLIVNSYGGCTAAAFALIDVMAGSRIPLQTIGLGVVSSAGLLISMAGHRNMRVLTPNTRVLSHQYWSGNTGKHHELLAAQKCWELEMQRILRHYKRHTRMQEAAIRKFLLPPEDVWLSAEEALKYGLCDEVRDPAAVAGAK